ncbi:Glu-tRNA(Gln) amidotransferase subunit GatE [Candidatus Bathyarchaeota archaeon]|nr:Glu-tRNA(Gln) amidotransferase subunit GatE [Candidatus Bathyarchaeota archaeon]
MNKKFIRVGLKAGLEIHQQLDTKEKLFCSCEPKLFKENPDFSFIRKLRPAQSELGKVDSAALFEFNKEKQILYEGNNETSCLVEMDEEPPHNLNNEAVEVALLTSLMMKMNPVDEIHVMRKMVIDGSNTTGFQRTCIVALNGEIDINGKKITISQVSLEEDAARIMGKDGQFINYRIDRLGIPLIEVTTAPCLYTPEEAKKAAAVIGKILRATRRVKRGLGTIRQDVNVSIRNGALIEIKGVQELELVSQIIENEVQRQENLLQIRDELKKRGLEKEEITEEFINVTNIFKTSKCTVIQNAIKKNHQVIAVKLPKFGGLLKKELAKGMRFGSELSGFARFWGRVGGIFHTDEMPAYGISEDEIYHLGKIFKITSQDAVVFVADTKNNARDALKAVIKRARIALECVPEETRAANPDGTTNYMRPRPGAARMYPETDVVPITLTKKYLTELENNLPELPDQINKRLKIDYKINSKLINQILKSKYLELFETIAKETDVSPTIIAVALTETIKALNRDGVKTNVISNEQFRELFSLIASGKTTKESIPKILSWLAKNMGTNVEEALKDLGLLMMTQKEVGKLIDTVLEENFDFIKQRGTGAFGPVMGLVMKKARGRVNPKIIKEILKTKLDMLQSTE